MRRNWRKQLSQNYLGHVVLVQKLCVLLAIGSCVVDKEPDDGIEQWLLRLNSLDQKLGQERDLLLGEEIFELVSGLVVSHRVLDYAYELVSQKRNFRIK